MAYVTVEDWVVKFLNKDPWHIFKGWDNEFGMQGLSEWRGACKRNIRRHSGWISGHKNHVYVFWLLFDGELFKIEIAWSWDEIVDAIYLQILNVKIMNDQQIENKPKQRLSQISRDEVDIINDIRELNFGRINIIIQDGVIVNKEITKVVKNVRVRNGGRRNTSGNKNSDSGNGFSNNGSIESSRDEEMY